MKLELKTKYKLIKYDNTFFSLYIDDVFETVKLMYYLRKDKYNSIFAYSNVDNGQYSENYESYLINRFNKRHFIFKKELEDDLLIFDFKEQEIIIK
jgi:hypothetical protein